MRRATSTMQQYNSAQRALAYINDDDIYSDMEKFHVWPRLWYSMSEHADASLRPLTPRMLVYADDDNDLYFVNS